MSRCREGVKAGGKADAGRGVWWITTHGSGGFDLRRVLVLAVVAVSGVLAWSATASTTKPAKISLYKTSIGKILVCKSGCPSGQAGYTVYAFTKDRGTKDRCQRNSACIQTWPPVLTKGTPIAGTGVKQSLLGTTRLRNGKHQVTYAGHPLYTFTGDKSPGEANGNASGAFGGTWTALKGSGEPAK